MQLTREDIIRALAGKTEVKTEGAPVENPLDVVILDSLRNARYLLSEIGSEGGVPDQPGWLDNLINALESDVDALRTKHYETGAWILAEWYKIGKYSTVTSILMDYSDFPLRLLNTIYHEASKELKIKFPPTEIPEQPVQPYTYLPYETRPFYSRVHPTPYGIPYGTRKSRIIVKGMPNYEPFREIRRFLSKD